MLSGLSAAARLAGAGWRLARADALLPRELRALYPPGLERLSRLAGLLAGPAARRGRPGERLARCLEGMGPVAIKLGQLLSTRADIFGVEFAQDLARLKDRLDPFPADVARREIAASLGRPVEALFSEFGPPVAAASLAQAHEARLADGRRVAVKVLRPGIERQVEADAWVMGLAAGLAERFAPDAKRLEPRTLSASVIESVRRELDLRLEAAGADELRAIMALDGYMSAPAVVWEGVGRRVLTLEWARGTPLSDAA
ncbi:MAG: ABC1 kinase family protein, partial [Phenylobacterium sp.]